MYLDALLKNKDDPFRNLESTHTPMAPEGDTMLSNIDK